MTALKVGDRVHVEFDGNVSSISQTKTYILVDNAWIENQYVTKLSDPEPEWAQGDVILHGTVLYQLQGDYWIAMSGGFAKPVLVSTWWAAGDIQRLAPEAQK